MSSDNGKQVDDALEAIRKLVEMSEQKLDDKSDIVTLDHVVWRNPVADEDYDDTQIEAETKVIMPKTASFSQAPLPPSQMTKLSSQDDEIKTNESEADAQPALANISDATDEAKSALSSSAEKTDNLEKQPLSPASYEDEITELSAPIGRRGGGFYQDLPKKPVVTTQPPANSSPITKQAQQASIVTPKPKPEPEIRPPKPEVRQPAPQAVEPKFSVSSTYFSGQDFSLPASEAFMTPTSLKELNEADRPDINPEINVPIADPPVDDPVREVQIMFNDEEEDDSWEPISQPNLQLVSDSRYEDEVSEEDEGFSGTVRSALRSIIKEQVTSWLHNNMTDLIEDALSAPPQRPARSTRKTQPKRRDK